MAGVVSKETGDVAEGRRRVDAADLISGLLAALAVQMLRR